MKLTPGVTTDWVVVAQSGRVVGYHTTGDSARSAVDKGAARGVRLRLLHRETALTEIPHP